jgi:hypothetical protein
MISARSAPNISRIHHKAAVMEESLASLQWKVDVKEEGGCWEGPHKEASSNKLGGAYQLGGVGIGLVFVAGTGD